MNTYKHFCRNTWLTWQNSKNDNISLSLARGLWRQISSNFVILLLSSDQTVDQPRPSLGDVPGIRLRHHQWKHRPGSQHSLRDQDDGGQQQQQQQQLLQQLQRCVAPLFLHERLSPSQVRFVTISNMKCETQIFSTFPIYLVIHEARVKSIKSEVEHTLGK